MKDLDDPAFQLFRAADELRALACNGLHYEPAAEDRRRLELMRDVAARLTAIVDGRPATGIARIFAADDGPRTPLVAVELIASNGPDHVVTAAEGARERLPVTYLELHETPAMAIDRLVRTVVGSPSAATAAARLAGLRDDRHDGELRPHTCHLVFALDLAGAPVTEGYQIRSRPALADAGLQLLDAGDLHNAGADAPLSERAETVPTETPQTETPPAETVPTETPPTETPPTETVPTEIGQLRRALDRLATTGLRDTRDHYNEARYRRVLEIAAGLRKISWAGGTARRSPIELEIDTPRIGAEIAVFDTHGRILLIQRRDTGEWALPGGACEVGESPAETAARETFEETTVTVSVTAPVGVYDNRTVAAPPVSIQVACVFLGSVVSGEGGVTHEATACRWVAPDQLAGLTFFHGHRTKVHDSVAVFRGLATAPIMR